MLHLSLWSVYVKSSGATLDPNILPITSFTFVSYKPVTVSSESLMKS